MKKQENMIAILFSAALAVLSSCAGEKPVPSDQMVDVGTHRLQLHQQGSGSPVVVIDSGLGDFMDQLKPLQERLAKVTRVCTYNRAGYGQSEAGPLPRDCGREAEELKALLDRAAVPGPYVIVGHSLGALNAQMFAAKFPKDVAGIVLLDPPPLSFLCKKDYTELSGKAETMTAEWQAIADSGAASADPQERSKADTYRMIASEHRETFGESARQITEILSFGNTPLVVMAAGKPNPELGDVAEEFQKYWIGQSHTLSRKSSNSRFILAEKSSHYLYLDEPDLVAETILSVVKEARKKR
ncbi:MAG: alpha/beta fold hydrolase [Candidatus Aminicenantales bacterium]